MNSAVTRIFRAQARRNLCRPDAVVWAEVRAYLLRASDTCPEITEMAYITNCIEQNTLEKLAIQAEETDITELYWEVQR
jgi:hypothetical protein